MLTLSILSIIFISPFILLYFKRDIFNPVGFFLTYLAIGVYLRAIVLTSSASDFQGTFWNQVEWKLEPLLHDSLISLTFCIAATILLYLIIPRSKAPPKIIYNTFSIRPEKISPNRLIIISAFFLLSYLLLLGKSQGGIYSAIYLLQKRSLVFDSDVFYIKIINVFFCTSALILYFIALSQKTNTTLYQRACIYTLIFASLGLLFLTGGRGAFLSQLISLVFIRHVTVKSKQLTKALIPIAIITVIVATIISGLALRESAQKQIAFADALKNTSSQVLETVTGTFPVIDLFSASVAFADYNGHDYGVQFVNYFTRIIPRSIWPDKPLIIGLQIREFLSGHTLSGVPPTIFGEFYIAYGLYGLGLSGLVLAIFLKFLDACHRKSFDDPGFSIFYAIALIQLIFSSLRAGLEISLFTFLYFLTGIILIKFLSTKINHNRRYL